MKSQGKLQLGTELHVCCVHEEIRSRHADASVHSKLGAFCQSEAAFDSYFQRL